MKKPLIIPKFQSEHEEAEFWNETDLASYFSAADFEPVNFPNLKPTSTAISIRIPELLLSRIKEKANQINIPYQSLIKKTLGDVFL